MHIEKTKCFGIIILEPLRYKKCSATEKYTGSAFGEYGGELNYVNKIFATSAREN